MSEEIPTVAIGDKIVYIREDAGQTLSNDKPLPNGSMSRERVTLRPGVPLSVGTDVSLGLAQELVTARKCALVEGPKELPTVVVTAPKPVTLQATAVTTADEKTL